jgi:hypothetical protein
VALLVRVLRCYAELTWPRAVVGCLLPLSAIVVALSALNLEKAVFEIMGGFREESTANDGAYAILMLLTFFAVFGSIPLLVIYLILARLARLDARAR